MSLNPFKKKQPSAPLPPPPPAMKVFSTNDTRQKNSTFDADKFAYDVDTRTGLFYAVTFDFFVNGHGICVDNDPVVTNVPYSEEVLARVPEGKREIFLEKFGKPVSAEEKMNQLLEQVAEITKRLPAPRQPIKPTAPQAAKPRDLSRIKGI